MSWAAPPLHAQVPGIIQPFDSEEDLYHRANRYYQFGNDQKDLYEKRQALRASIPLFREYLRTRPPGELAQQASYQLGMALLMTGDLEDAERTFRYVINHYRTGQWVAMSAYRQAAQLYNRREWGKAASFFRVAAAQSPEAHLRHKSTYYEARCLVYAKQGNAAIAHLNRMVNDPTNPFRQSARLMIGEIHAEAGRHQKALEQFESLLGPETNAAQERSQALLLAGVSASKLGRLERAQALLNQTIDSPGLDLKAKTKAQLALMEMRFEEDNHAETIKVFRRGEFLGETGDQSRIYMIAGKSFAKLDRHNEAISQFFNAERLAPLTELGFEASYRRLASFYQINSRNIPSQVDAFLEIYAESHPSSPWIQKARLMKAEILFHQGTMELASLAYNDINVSAIPEELRADIYFKRGWCLGDTGDFGRAAQNLSSFINNYPEHANVPEALAKRGQAYLQLGDRTSALKDFSRLLEDQVDPALASFARQHSGRIHREERNFEKMIENYQELLQLEGNLESKSRANANYWIGWGYYKLEQWDQAIPHLEAARDLLPQRYRESAGVHIVLSAYSLLDSDKLKTAVERLMVDAPAQRFPARMMIWLGLERFSKGDYEAADRYLGFASTPNRPDLTEVIVWRHLGKSQIEIRHFDRALETLDILLEHELEEFWKADALLDRSHALIGSGKWEEARTAALDGLELDPQGTVRAGLYMALADIAMHRKDYQSAARSYLDTSDMFIGDKEIKPLALFRAAEALELDGQLEEAAGIRRKLHTEFPNWSAAKPE
ncbi:MAG: tetratricopeptide repeat protein [Akkermansiaceae bacterium]|nr:tetratricopeptide repeat protein [Akkermansiaceae bacterium]